MSCYIVCSTVRSGSTLLCKTLSRLYGFGQPEEYFHRHIIRDLQLDGHPEAFGAYCQKIVAAQETTQKFGLKMHWWQLKDFVRLAQQQSQGKDKAHAEGSEMTVAETLQRFFPDAKFIYLKRQDVLAQAVSAAIATQTGKWEKTEAISTKPIKFQPWRIYEWEQSLIAQNHDWEQFFASNNLDYLPVVYEDMVADFTSEVAQITRYIKEQDIEDDNSIQKDRDSASDQPVDIEMPTKRQWSPVNQRFITAYRRIPKPVLAGLFWLYQRRSQQVGDNS